MDSEGTVPSFLQTERSSAFLSRKYDSKATRNAIHDKFGQACPGTIPHEWQMDVTEAILLGLDCIVIAGTGAGKTMPFIMPLLLDETKTKRVFGKILFDGDADQRPTPFEDVDVLPSRQSLPDLP